MLFLPEFFSILQTLPRMRHLLRLSKNAKSQAPLGFSLLPGVNYRAQESSFLQAHLQCFRVGDVGLITSLTVGP